MLIFAEEDSEGIQRIEKVIMQMLQAGSGITWTQTKPPSKYALQRSYANGWGGCQ